MVEHTRTIVGVDGEALEDPWIEVDGDGMTLSRDGLNLVELQRPDAGETPGIA